MEATFLTPTETAEWSDAPHFVLGPVNSRGRGEPISVGVSDGPTRRWRVDLHSDVGYGYFRDLRCVSGLVYIGYGEHVVVFTPDAATVEAYRMDGYFGHLYTAADLEVPNSEVALLATSASELLRFSEEGRLMWRCSNLGCDGVLIHSIKDDVIVGDGEFDPPGGWRPIRVDLESGQSRQAQEEPDDSR